MNKPDEHEKEGAMGALSKPAPSELVAPKEEPMEKILTPLRRRHDLPILQYLGLALVVLGTLTGVTTVTLFGTILTGITTALNLSRQARRSKQTDEFQNKVREQQEELAQQQTRIGEQQQEIKALNSDLRKLTLESHGMITGGDSFVYLLPMLVEQSSGIAFMAMHQGDYPVYDLTIQVQDQRDVHAYLDEWESKNAQQPARLSFEEMVCRSARTTRLASLAKSTAQQDFAWKWSLKGVDWRCFIITISARNGLVMEHVGVRRVNGQWSLAYRATRAAANGPPIVLTERIPENFPRRPNGEPDWEPSRTRQTEQGVERTATK